MFRLRPEDGFIKKPKHVASMIFELSCNYVIYNKGYVRLKTYVNFIRWYANCSFLCPLFAVFNVGDCLSGE
jgi:hypothetical protein